MTKTFETRLLADGFSFLEGPRWRDGHLWVSDMRGEAVFRVDEQGRRERVATIPGWPSGLGFLPDGSLLAVGMNEKKLFRVKDGSVSTYADLGGIVSSPLNDMLVTRAGRCYVGDIGYDFYANEPSAPGGITLIEPDGTLRRVASGLQCPNAMVFRADTSALCVAESFGHRLVEFTCDASGGLSDPRVLIELPGEVPDGICLDAEGGIWVSCFLGNRFVHVDRNGTIDAEIKVPGRNAVACQLGGSDGRSLFCLTYDRSAEDMVAGVPGSRIELARVDVPGAGSP